LILENRILGLSGRLAVIGGVKARRRLWQATHFIPRSGKMPRHGVVDERSQIFMGVKRRGIGIGATRHRASQSFWPWGGIRGDELALRIGMHATQKEESDQKAAYLSGVIGVRRARTRPGGGTPGLIDAGKNVVVSAATPLVPRSVEAFDEPQLGTTGVEFGDARYVLASLGR